jgi:hypothetical protein
MKKFLLKSSLVMFSSLLLLAFKGNDAIIIKIDSPTIKSVYKVRDTIWIKANVTASESLHDVSIRVIDTRDSVEMYSKHIHSHGSSMAINEYYINPVTEKANMRLVISTSGHGGTETARSHVDYKCLAKAKKK